MHVNLLLLTKVEPELKLLLLFFHLPLPGSRMLASQPNVVSVNCYMVASSKWLPLGLQKEVILVCSGEGESLGMRLLHVAKFMT